MENHMTAAHRTTTIGRLTGISCSISHCWTARLKFRLWESGLDAEALDRQLAEAGCDARRALPFHSMLLADQLPLTIGGGIGQSRICMLLMSKAHIGEVQCSIWDCETIESCEKAGIVLL